jgi:hypothetical protein
VFGIIALASTLGRNAMATMSLIPAIVLLSWFFQWKPLGDLLLDMGRTEQGNSLVWLGIMEMMISCALAFTVFWRVSHGLLLINDLFVDLSPPILVWFCGIHLTVQGLSRLRVGEKAIGSSMIWAIGWQNIKSYYYEPSKPNVLTLQVKQGYPFIPKFRSIVIPVQHLEALDQILCEKLPDRHSPR